MIRPLNKLHLTNIRQIPIRTGPRDRQRINASVDAAFNLILIQYKCAVGERFLAFTAFRREMCRT